MRPPQNAGESTASAAGGVMLNTSFNEAPAERGGKSGGGTSLHPEGSRFNEAPAERGGKSPSLTTSCSRVGSFNEAPAERGGKSRRRPTYWRLRPALQ